MKTGFSFIFSKTKLVGESSSLGDQDGPKLLGRGVVIKESAGDILVFQIDREGLSKCMPLDMILNRVKFIYNSMCLS